MKLYHTIPRGESAASVERHTMLVASELASQVLFPVLLEKTQKETLLSIKC